MARPRTLLTLKDDPMVRRTMEAVATARITRQQGISTLQALGYPRTSAQELIATSFEQDWRIQEPEPPAGGWRAIRAAVRRVVRELVDTVLACLRQSGKQTPSS